MRLGQLSRKLGLKPSDIQTFLGGIGLEAGPNTRLTDDQVIMAVRHFDPSKEAGIFEVSTPESIDEVSAVAPVQEQETEVKAELPAVEEATQLIQPTAEEVSLEVVPEVIRAPKLELPGLKVVGKIELRDPRKKEDPEQSTEGPVTSTPTSVNPERSDRPARPIRRERPQPRTWNNPLEMQRQREAEERREKHDQELQAEKDRRTQKYLKKVKSSPTKPVRRQEESVVETQVETKPAPKSWLGKFARWLTT